MTNLRTPLVAGIVGILSLVACADGGDALDRAGGDDDITQVRSPLCSPLPLPCGTFLWPGGVISYEYDAGVPGSETMATTMRGKIRAAMNNWQTVTNNRITFQLNAGAPDRMKIVNNGNCFTQRGKRSGVHLAQWSDTGCPYDHELGHTIGLEHEHMRFDRDRYVQVSDAACTNPNYVKCALTDDQSTDFGEYDLSSTMQYQSGGSPPDLTLRSTGGLITTGSGLPTARDVSAVFELYARELGPWKKFNSMGLDVSSTAPLDNSLAPGQTIKPGTSPAATRDATALAQFVFVRGTDNKIYWKTTPLNQTPSWSNWTPVSANGTSSTSAPAAGYSTLNEAMVGELSSDGNIRIADRNGTSWNWTNLTTPTGKTVASTPAIVTTTSLGTHVFVRLTDNTLWSRSRPGGPSTGWGPWTSRGGTQLRGAPAAVARTDSTLDVFSNTSGGQLNQISFNGSWSSWSVVANGACCLKSGTSPTVASPAPGRMDVLFWGADDQLSWKKFAGGAWGAPKVIGGRLTASPAAVGYGGSRINVWILGDNGGLWMRQHMKRVRGDWNGDGRADFSLVRTDGSIHVKPSSGGTEIVKPALAANALPVTFDKDADGLTDTVYRRTTDFTWFFQTTAGEGPGNTQWGASGDYVAIGDYDGDGRDDFTVVRPPNYTWFVLSNAAYISESSTDWGTTGDVPVPRDYDGDGRDDKAVWRQSDGKWYVIYSSTGTSPPAQQWGQFGDIPLPGDYDGDGKADLTVFRPSTGTWFITYSSDGSTTSVVWAPTSGVQYMPRDYDGDGKTDLAYFKASDTTWHYKSSYSGNEIVVTFGLSTDTAF